MDSHSLGANHSQIVLAEFALQNLFDGNGDVFRAFGLSRDRTGVLGTNGELTVGAKLLDLGAVNSSLIERRADFPYVRRLCELELHQCATRKLDAEIQRLDGEGAQAENEESSGDCRHHLPPADEVVVGVVKNSKH